MTVNVSETPTSIDATLRNPDLAKEQRGLLDLIDKLQYAQLDNIKLPQIAVVGDQSAGKSSVLESITGIPFPRKADACTRFATEIRLRRGNQEQCSIRIIPDKKSRSPAEQERLKRFGDNIDNSMSFNNLMNLAIDQIVPKNVPGRFVAEDILVVERRGPDLPLLTVVDLPGFVKVPNQDQTTDDIKAINDLADRYMKSSRTIILAVVGGNQDYVQAPVLTKVREFDCTGARTIGVLTKPDMTHDNGLQDKFIALVNNKDTYNQFKLGWYVLLNPGPFNSPPAEDRKRNERAFFATGAWGKLPKEMCGAKELERKLSVQLQQHIGKHIRKLQKEIQKAHDDCVSELKALGTGKDTIDEMKTELVQLCSDSEKLVFQAVHGTYINPPGKTFFCTGIDEAGTPIQNLRARAIEQNQLFANRIRTQGAKFQFTSSNSEDTKGKQSATTKEHFIQIHVQELIRQRTGKELPGDHDPSLVYTLFKDNSEKWTGLAQDHKNEIGLICSEFLGEIIDCVWPDRMREPLRVQFLDPQMKIIREEAQKVVDALLEDLQSDIRPYDHEYENRLRAWREGAPADRPYSAAEELLEKMTIYYELTVKTFITNVITQVIERHLLKGLLRLFDSVKIFTMESQIVEAIAAEDVVTKDLRVALKARKLAIEDARDLCNNLAMRKELKSYSKNDPEDETDGSDQDESGAGMSHKKADTTPKPDRTPRSVTNQPAVTKPTPGSERRETKPSRPSVPLIGPAEAYNVHESSSTIHSATNVGTEAWMNQLPTNYPKPVTHVPPPQGLPPPVPSFHRSEETRQPSGSRHYPPSPPDSVGHQHSPAQEPYARGDDYGYHQYQNPFSQHDVNDARPVYSETNNKGYAQTPVKNKLTRKLLGS